MMGLGEDGGGSAPSVCEVPRTDGTMKMMFVINMVLCYIRRLSEVNQESFI